MKQITFKTLFNDNQTSVTPAGELNITHSTKTFHAYKNENIGNKVGNKKYWIGHVATDGVDWYTMTTFWQETSDGTESKRQTSAAKRVTQKNVGKANETSLEQQAYSELTSLVNKQIDKKYVPEDEELKSSDSMAYPLPMLAHKYHEKKNKVNFSVWAQPKYDGVRILSNGETMWSRKGKPMIQECIEHLLIDTKGYNIDGELILPPPYSFQDTISAVKKYNADLSSQLLYRVYDVMITDTCFSERFKILTDLVKHNSNSHIVLAETTMIDSEHLLEKYHEEKVAEGWEGVIVRADLGGYEVNKRANQLLKYKSFDDDEFEVIGVKTGDGKFEGLGILECVTKTGAVFSATPKGTVEFRRKLYEQPDLVIGKMWKVQFFGWTNNPDPSQIKPRFPIALCERDLEIEG
jgi:DNA ligase-1